MTRQRDPDGFERERAVHASKTVIRPLDPAGEAR
jgi:hypothetical protein